MTAISFKYEVQRMSGELKADSSAQKTSVLMRRDKPLD